MQQSIAVIIFNEEFAKRDKLDIIKNTFYEMNMNVAVLVNKSAKELQEVIQTITQMDPYEIQDIIFVIYAKQFNNSDRKFITADRKIFHFYDNIINFLLEIDGFEDKQKIILFNISGNDNQTDLVPFETGKTFRCISHGSKVHIVLSRKENFIKTIFPELVKHRNLSRAIRENKNLFELEMITAGDIKLKVPTPSTELTSEFHEFVIG